MSVTVLDGPPITFYFADAAAVDEFTYNHGCLSMRVANIGVEESGSAGLGPVARIAGPVLSQLWCPASWRVGFADGMRFFFGDEGAARAFSKFYAEFPTTVAPVLSDDSEENSGRNDMVFEIL